MKRRRLIHNLKSLNNHRHQLRHNLTSAEALLWTNLKESKLEGKKFRRQHSIGPYIADFYCPECRVIVELDGAGHEGPLEIERDDRRTNFLRNYGIRVLRFGNKDVFQNLEGVLEIIRTTLQETRKFPY